MKLRWLVRWFKLERHLTKSDACDGDSEQIVTLRRVGEDKFDSETAIETRWYFDADGGKSRSVPWIRAVHMYSQGIDTWFTTDE